ncbi:(Dimethylallyl)adenosine tRNA methylthiotransferase MiaB [bacterium BMS3Bbin14]|nr:(Dimethylallyl)adenosine tRNA methylthiotransferase MiaB [bacterium BMS3Abin13]GBE52025.1 (Dimethylallyl)adenosine tRNA methylthiotransferase MiaB [bacterium BMS3Bbin14]
MKQRSLYIKTFGCQMNKRDSEIIEQLLFPCGFLPTAEMEAADLVILNTCSIRAKAEQKVFSLLGQIKQWKLSRPEMRVAVTGCVAQQEGEKIFRRMPHVDLVVGTQQIYRIPELIRQLDAGETSGRLAIDLDKKFAIPPYQALSPAPHEFRKFITIMQGCNNYCSYCVVPATRGRETSRPVADILDEANLLIAQGVREITLLGQNVNSYGKTNPVAEAPVDFAALLHKVAAIDGLERLRFTTSNPKDLSDELIRCFTEIDILCPHFHLPVQSGSDRVLARMNRRYTVAEYLEKVEKLLDCRPDIAMSTDIIVGFPGESDQDFEETMKLLDIVRYHGSFSFKYSDRPGTRSAFFDNKVDEKVKSERLSRFQKRQNEIGLARNKKYVNTTLDIMVEGTADPQLFQGRSTTNHIVHFPPPAGRELHEGDTIRVHIQHAGLHSLTGTAAEEETE